MNNTITVRHTDRVMKFECNIVYKNISCEIDIGHSPTMVGYCMIFGKFRLYHKAP